MRTRPELMSVRNAVKKAAQRRLIDTLTVRSGGSHKSCESFQSLSGSVQTSAWLSFSSWIPLRSFNQIVLRNDTMHCPENR
ncbi:hypothetical protein ACLKA6_001217 [Drosophila palustris]